MYRRDLSRNVDTFRDFDFARLKWAPEVNVLNLLAKGRFGADETNQTVLHSEQDICAFLDSLLDHTAGLDKKFLATTFRQPQSLTSS